MSVRLRVLFLILVVLLSVTGGFVIFFRQPRFDSTSSLVVDVPKSRPVLQAKTTIGDVSEWLQDRKDKGKLSVELRFGNIHNQPNVLVSPVAVTNGSITVITAEGSLEFLPSNMVVSVKYGQRTILECRPAFEVFGGGTGKGRIHMTSNLPLMPAEVRATRPDQHYLNTITNDGKSCVVLTIEFSHDYSGYIGNWEVARTSDM